MSFLAGIDLHSNNNYIGLIDMEGKRLLKKNNPNSLECILKTLNPLNSKIIVNKGQVVKIVKDKSGNIISEVLTKDWTNWIVYQAVGFYFR